MSRVSQNIDRQYDRSIQELKDADRYSSLGESEYSRERADPYEMADYLIDKDFSIERNYRGKGPKNYRRSDNRIYEEVCEILLRDPEVDARQIEVDVRGGEVVLKGFVDSRRTKRIAELSIENISGVTDVMNLLRIMI